MFEFKLLKIFLRMFLKICRREKEKKFRLINGLFSLDIYKVFIIF